MTNNDDMRDIHIFWDIENCAVPGSGKVSVQDIVNNLTNVLRENKNCGRILIHAYGDVRNLRATLPDALTAANAYFKPVEVRGANVADKTSNINLSIVAGMIALMEAVAIGRTFASMKDYQVDGNKEMIALGTMNVAGSMTSCYVATGSFSRSAVNYMAGCQTAVSNIVMSLVVFLTLKFLTPLFEYTPNEILSSIIISAVIGLIDYEAAVLIWKIDKFDFVACMGAFFGVVFASVEIGLLIAVSISFAKILLQVTRPRTAILGRIPFTSVYRNMQQYPEASKVPGVLIVRVDSAIYFSNSNYIKERILRWLTEEEDHLKKTSQPRIHFLIIEMSPVTDIDTSGIHAFEELYKSLVKVDVQVSNHFEKSKLQICIRGLDQYHFSSLKKKHLIKSSLIQSCNQNGWFY